MYETYTRQALPEKKYRELVWTAICVFNSNNSFIIENYLRTTISTKNRHQLIDLESWKLLNLLRKESSLTEQIITLFSEIVYKRNRIVHSFQVTDTSDNTQKLCTKDKNQVQFIITEEYLLKFIDENWKLSNFLHEFRWF